MSRVERDAAYNNGEALKTTLHWTPLESDSNIKPNEQAAG